MDYELTEPPPLPPHQPARGHAELTPANLPQRSDTLDRGPHPDLGR